MDSHRLSKVIIAVNVASFIFLLLAMTSSAARSTRYYDDVFPVLVQRRGENPACRRCTFNRNDWSSCASCFRHARYGGSRIPYYGFRKRSSLDDDVREIPADVIECCADTGNPECCRQLGYMSQGHGGVVEPRYLSIMDSDQLASADPECSCCDTSIYDIVCCQARCNV